MDINSVRVPILLNDAVSVSSLADSAEQASRKSIDFGNLEAGKDQAQTVDYEKEYSSEEINQITDRLNKFMENINTDLRFEIHEKTNRVMVQVVNSKDNTVIKEFPPHELLDTLAAISDYVGLLLDKKA
ncbi:hypothetical protein DP73_06750 [Desulfosporosinus sp. HMP52]|uniref:flagellar protein FlaG n=1 Tax=Desulfosporosinus sp. HMP52 TaxID=1487923 RepID=UPI00051FCE7F|nr:flagellar protein FlaG [Desulfosporosinus sp. HMP52]KGK90344.1 hypothetical protein DP73_06750 [Desulfosporosinus sp. HMP52]